MRIELEKSKIPYIFTLKSDNKIYKLSIKHFKYNNSIYIDVMNENNDILLENERLIYGRPLGTFLIKDNNGNYNNDFLNCYIVPLSLDNKETVITYDNFLETVFLEFFSLGEIDE